MSKLSFKGFMAEANIQANVLATVRRQLGTSDFTSSETIDDRLIKDARRVSHKFVDTPSGPWVVDVLQAEDQPKVARAVPPKESGGKTQYFVASEAEAVEEDEIFAVAELVFEASSNVIAPIHSSKQFSYNKSTKTFSTEASTLGRGSSFMKHVWNDSADVGFGIESAKTGEVVLFTLSQEHRDREHDITHWTFSVYNPKRDPKLNGLKVIVFND